MATYYTLRPSFSARTATRRLSSATHSAPPDDSKRARIAGIAGGTAGGLVGLGVILALVLLCLHRRKKTQKQEAAGGRPLSLPPPAELAVTAFPHEISTSSTAGKPVAMHDGSTPSDARRLPLQPVGHDAAATGQQPAFYGLVSPITGAHADVACYPGDNGRSYPWKGTAQDVSPTAVAVSPGPHASFTPQPPVRSQPQGHGPPPADADAESDGPRLRRIDERHQGSRWQVGGMRMAMDRPAQGRFVEDACL